MRTDVAFLCSGQGSQRVGMASRLLAEHPELARELERADDALGFPLSRLIAEGPAEELTLTENAQPAMLLVGYLAGRLLRERGVAPLVLAGHSLGEITALALADAFPLDDALRLVRARGRFMQDAVAVGVGTMAALKTGDPAVVKDIVDAVDPALGLVVAANFNGPDQIVLSGHVAAVREAIAVARKRRVVGREIPVSAPFHCELMRPAAERFSEVLGGLEVATRLAVPVVTNVSAEPVESGAAAREFLALQVTHPVRWEACVRRTHDLGARAYVELGPGEVLSKLNGKILPDAETLSVEATGIDGVVAALGGRGATDW